jgi:hypothetical protein
MVLDSFVVKLKKRTERYENGQESDSSWAAVESD